MPKDNRTIEPESAKRFLQPKGLAASPSYTHVVTATGGTTIWISGQVALDEAGNLVGRGDLAAQTTQVFENLKCALAAAGASFQDVVKTNYYVVDYRPEQVTTIREVRSRYVSADKPPASTLVGVAALAYEGLLIEIEAVAVVPAKAKRL